MTIWTAMRTVWSSVGAMAGKGVPENVYVHQRWVHSLGRIGSGGSSVSWL